jgi:uncharacterized membrane protein
VAQHSKKTWIFILTLIIFPSLAIIIPDLVLGRRTSVTGRYMIPSYLGIQLAVFYLLGAKVNSTLVNFRQNKFWKLALLAVLSSGVISCTVVSQAETWWNNFTDSNNRQLVSNNQSSQVIR